MGRRVLIIEDEFLIALGIQSIIEGVDGTQAVLARSFREAAELAGRFSEFDLAIVNPPAMTGEDAATAARLREACPAIVVCTAASIDLAAGPLADAEVLIKPFLDDQLLDACRRAEAKQVGRD